jgi:1-acyl-sn-glycerol-3-phosphate acyltransferase
MGPIGQLFSFITGTAVDVFYRRRIIEGAIPKTGPVLLVANHPNALMDPAIVQNVAWSSARRRVRMLAKAPLFTMPGVSVLVKGMDALPVYRSKDGADTKGNEKTFAAVKEALVGGSAVLIFPEGISHDEPAVQPLKTGAARMALDAVAGGARDLVIVPVGLSYADKLRFRSTAAVEIGTPLKVADFAVAAGGDGETGGGGEAERDAARALTAAIAAALQKVTVNLETWEDLPLLEAIDAIWRQDDPERSRRLKNLAEGTAALRQQDPGRFDELRARLSDWLRRLEQVGLRPRDVADGAVAARRNPAKLVGFLLRNFAALVFALPLAVAGAVFWFVPFWTVHVLWLISRVQKDTGASVKVLSGMVVFPLWWCAVVVAAAVFVDPGVAAAIAVVAPGAGLTTRHFFRRRFFAVQQVATFVSLGFRGQVVRDLLRERDAFCAAFDDVAAAVERGGSGAGAGEAAATR